VKRLAKHWRLGGFSQCFHSVGFVKNKSDHLFFDRYLLLYLKVLIELISINNKKKESIKLLTGKFFKFLNLLFIEKYHKSINS
jgi:hypothetical protein